MAKLNPIEAESTLQTVDTANPSDEVERYTLCRFCQERVELEASNDAEDDFEAIALHYERCPGRQPSESGSGGDSGVSNLRSSQVSGGGLSRDAEAGARKPTARVPVHNVPKAVSDVRSPASKR